MLLNIDIQLFWPSCLTPLSQRRWPVRPLVVPDEFGVLIKELPGLDLSFVASSLLMARSTDFIKCTTPAIIPSRVSLLSLVER